MMDKDRATIVLVTAVLFVFGVVAAYLFFPSSGYKYHTTVAGVKVDSDVPFTEVHGYRYIALLDSVDRDVLACNLELSAVSLPDNGGHLVEVRKADSSGIYIRGGSVVIEGDSSATLLNACHAFACLRDDLSCPKDLDLIRRKSLGWKRVNVLLDSGVGVDAYSGFVEVLAALGYLQGKSAEPVDLDGDGVITREEIAEGITENLLLIFPYVMNDSVCTAQPFNSALQRLEPVNESFDCAGLSPSIRFIHSDVNKISVQGDDVVIEGDDMHIHTGSIIVRDVIAPGFILSLYNL